MPKYATGKHALAISDRSGLQFPWREMVTEWTGAFVHILNTNLNNLNYDLKL